MRKFILSLGVAAVAVASLTSCGDKKGSDASTEDKAFADSVARAMGQFSAYNQASMLERIAEQDSAAAAKMTKEDFLAGLKLILESDTTKIGYYMGIQAGMQLLQPIMGINEKGIPVDPKVVYETFAEYFKKDSVGSIEEFYQNQYMPIQTALQERIRAKEMKAIEESEANKVNIEAGKQYADSLVKAGWTKSPSGLVYKIEEGGAAEKVQPNDKVAIYYTGSKLDGTVFDSTTPDKPYEAHGTSFVPGFNEALSLIGKGGKIKVAIPGELGYGLTGAGQIIGPNETMLFDIEVVDVTAPAAAPAAASADSFQSLQVVK